MSSSTAASSTPNRPSPSSPTSGVRDVRTARLMDRSAVQLRDDLAAGTVSAREVTEAALAAAEAHADLGAFTALDPDAARARTAQLDDTPRADRGPVHGLPLAFKDLIDVAGIPTRFGSALTADAAPATEDDPLVRQLSGAGAVTLGKTTVPEFGLDAHSDTPGGATARNPLDPSRTAGGSSGGAAAAVAAGILPFAPGSDGGGSIRIPAAACGLVGLKPGRGTVPTDPHLDSVRNLTVSGPLAHTVPDAALLFDAMTTTAPDDGRALADVQRTLARLASGDPPRPLRIGVTARSPFAGHLEISVATSAWAALTQAGALLDGMGHEVAETTPDYGPDFHHNFRVLWTSNLLQAPLPPDAAEHVGALAASFLREASARSVREVRDVVGNLEDWARGVRAQFASVDVVMTPVLAFAPPEVDSFLALSPEENYVRQCQFTPYTSMVNVLGLPAVSVPVFDDEQGLSWSVQLIGRPGTEVELLCLAATLEAR
ncbi:MAG: amidase [Micrococcus sp.]|nr:amidase [Micrococcus sp.]